MGYLLQAGKGQLELSNRARPIAEVLKDERVKPQTRELLVEIPRIKSFGEEHGLKPSSNYVEYVELDRPAAVWVVSASHPLRFEPRKWAFPIVGSFTYLGWFNHERALKYAEKLRESEDLDVDVRGAQAYSTLGWFRDPILSTMITSGKEALGNLVNVVLHESVHATLYIKNQSYFNESIASFIADRLTPIYLNRTRGRDSEFTQAYLKSETRQMKAKRDLRQAYLRLDRIYRSNVSDEEKLSQKKEILDALKEELSIKKEINNASLTQYRTYGVGKAEYDVLFRACKKNWKRFWLALNQITEESFSSPQQEDLAAVILPMARKGCPELNAKSMLSERS